MANVPSLATDVQQANAQYGSAVTSALATSMAGSLNYGLDQLGGTCSTFGVSSTVSGSFTGTSSAVTAIAASTLTFTSAGRPLIFQVGGVSSSSFFGQPLTGTFVLYLYRDGSEIGRFMGAASGGTGYDALPVFWDANASAGSHTWQLYYSWSVSSSSSISIAGCALFGWQI
jgi:hypothetical protein